MSETTKIYCVVAVGDSPLRWRRTWGWYVALVSARAAVKKCSAFIHECRYYEWCLIEEVKAGISAETQVIQWFKLNRRGVFVRSRRPPWARGICNWSMG